MLHHFRPTSSLPLKTMLSTLALPNGGAAAPNRWLHCSALLLIEFLIRPFDQIATEDRAHLRSVTRV